MTENNAAQAAIKAVPSTIWWHPDGYTVNNNFSGEDLILRSAALDALSKLHAEGVQAGDERAHHRNEGFSSLSLWWTMIEAEAELIGEPIKNDSPVLSFMGSGASHQVTAGDIRAALASAPVAVQEFKAAFPNGVLTSARFHELWERAGKTRNANYTLLENLTWQVGQFADLVAQAAIAPVAGELPDAVRVPLDSLHADAGYLVGRVLDHSLSRDEVVTVIRSRIDAAKAALAAPQASEAVRAALVELVECGKLQRDAQQAIWSGMSDRVQDGKRMQRQYEKRQPVALDAAISALYATPQSDKDGGDCAKGAGGVAMRDAAFEAVRMQLCKLPRYSFLSDGYGAVRRVEGKSGSWIGFDAAHALFDPVSVDAALSANPSVVKQSLTATQTGEKGESE